MAVWHAKNTGAYSRTTTAAKENAEMFYGVMYSLGWCLEAVCAALGNQEGESGYNPWRWGSDNRLPNDSQWIDTREPNPNPPPSYLNHAYGLFQQDPAGKYIHRPYAMALSTYAPNFSNQAGQPHDGDAQCRYLHWICSDPNGGEWLPNYDSYSMPFADFIANTQNKSVDYLVRTFFGSYERGTWDNVRITAANYWYNYLSGITPDPPTPPQGAQSWWGVLWYVTHNKYKYARHWGKQQK